MFVEGGFMEFIANLLSMLSMSAAGQNSRETWIFFFDEPECPKELL